MKIRAGFVSNSSSSSFILALKELPTNVYELRGLLFGQGDKYMDPHDDESYHDVAKIVEFIFVELRNSKPISQDTIADVISTGWFEGRPGLGNIDFRDKKAMDAYNAEVKVAAERLAAQFVKGCAFSYPPENRKFFLAKFWDDTELGAAVEHGDAFRSVPHLRISHH